MSYGLPIVEGQMAEQASVPDARSMAIGRILSSPKPSTSLSFYRQIVAQVTDGVG